MLVHQTLVVLIDITNQGIAEIPRVILEHLVIDLETKRTQILNDEYGCCAGIALGESMYLPQVCHKVSYVADYLITRKTTVIELPLLFKVILYCLFQLKSITIAYGVATQDPC